MSKERATFMDFVLKEWLVIVSGVGLVLTILFTKRLPVYSSREMEVLFILFTLFITANGLQKSGFILKIARMIETGRAIPLKIVVTTFFMSMVITNDIALIVIVPLTLSLATGQKGTLVILEALAANAGSALTPIGNPQNLFIYWFYGLHPFVFIRAIAPFSLLFLGLLTVFALFIGTGDHQMEKSVQAQMGQDNGVDRKASIYLILLVIELLTVFRVLPVLTGVLVVLFAIIFDRKALSIDYALLFTLIFFFGIADNLKATLSSEISRSGHVFMLSAMASQVISNVPATLLIAKFTSNWQALLWGANAGGFGSLFGSLANLIAYKIYVTHDGQNTVKFTTKFLVLGYTSLFVAIGLYSILYS